MSLDIDRMTKITDNRLAEIKAGCEGVTRGPWDDISNTKHVHVTSPEGSPGICDLYHKHTDGEFYTKPNALLNSAHIARMDPDTVLAMIARIEADAMRIAELEESIE